MTTVAAMACTVISAISTRDAALTWRSVHDSQNAVQWVSTLATFSQARASTWAHTKSAMYRLCTSTHKADAWRISRRKLSLGASIGCMVAAGGAVVSGVPRLGVIGWCGGAAHGQGEVSSERLRR